MGKFENDVFVVAGISNVNYETVDQHGEVVVSFDVELKTPAVSAAGVLLEEKSNTFRKITAALRAAGFASPRPLGVSVADDGKSLEVGLSPELLYVL